MAGTMATEYLTQPFLLSHDVDIGFAFSGLQVPIRITGVIGALLAFWFIARLGEVRTLLALPVIAILGYIGLAIWDALGAIALLALVGFVRSLAFPVVTGYINRRIPSDQRATVLSLNQVAFGLIVAPMVPALGISADKIDLPTGFAVAAGILAVLALITGIAGARTHRHPTDPNVTAPAQIVPPPHPALGVVARAKAQRGGGLDPQPALSSNAVIVPQDAASD